MIRIVLILLVIILFSSCKTTEKCEAYSEKYDINEQHQQEQSKYCSIETIK